MKQWSVQIADCNWDDDIFIGTFAECKRFCWIHDFKLDGVEARLAEIEVQDGLSTYVYSYYTDC